MSRFIALSVALLLAFAAAAPGFAQSRTTAGLIGTVKDEKGTPLPGVAVQISSPSLIGGARATTTDKDGEYRFPEIPPGTYSIEVSMPEYRKIIRDGVVLSVGRTAQVPIAMYRQAGDEIVRVSGEIVDIDPTSSETTTILPESYLSNIPTGRFQPDTLNLAPGINLDSAYGGGGSSANDWQIDGVDTSDPEAGSAWSFVNYNIIDQVQLVGLGAPAEYGGFTGVVFNSTTKSGSNRFSGLVDGYFSNGSLTSSNALGGINPTVEKFVDATAQAGGPFIKDKLWWFVSGQYFETVTNNGGPDRTEESPRGFAKLSWQMNANNKLEGWVEYDEYNITGRGGDTITPLEATVTEDAPEWVWNLTWRSAPTANDVLNVSWQGYDGYYYLDPARGYDIAGRYDSVSGTYNTNSTYYFLADRTRNNLNASLTHHADDFIKGDHDLKFGLEIERSSARNRYGYPTGVKFYDNYSGYNPNTNNYETYSIAYYGGGYDVHAKNQRLSAYVQDTWRITPRFTLNPGVRLDMNRGRVQGDDLVFNTNPVAPRLGFAWDITGDGKTLVKGHYGRYYEGLFGAFYYWMDPGAYEPLTTRNLWEDGFIEDVSTESKRFAMDPDLGHPYMDQFTAGFARELWPGFTLDVTAVYRKNKNFIETVSRDGVFAPVSGFVASEEFDLDATVSAAGSPGTGQRVTLFDYLNPDTDTLIVTNPDGLERTYEGIIITGTKRLSRGWQVLASYVFSRAKGNIDNVDFDLASDSGGQNGGPSPYLDTPNSLVNADGVLTHDQRHQVKLQGTYEIPQIGLLVSGNYTFHSGDTWTRKTRCLLTDDGNGTLGDGLLGCHDFPQGTVRYFAEERGSRRLPSRSELDLRVEWAKELEKGRLGVILDVFNVNNQARATEVQDRDQSGFGDVTSANLPRNFRFGARWSW